jgi:hypothetical protein
MHIVGRRSCHDNLVRCGIDAQMYLPPGPALRIAILADFPLAFAEHLEPRRIDHQMQRFPRWMNATRPTHGKGGSPPRQRRIARHWHIHAQQCDEGLHKSLCLAQRQTIYRLHSQHALHRQITIGLGSTTPSRGGGDPVFYRGRITPHGQTSALPEAVGIFPPVADTIAARWMFLVRHTSRYPCPMSYPQFR